MAFACLAEQIIDRHTNIFQDHLRGRGALEPHLLFFAADRKAVHAPLDQKR